MGTERKVRQEYLDALARRDDFPAHFTDDVVATFEGTDQRAEGREAAGQLILYVHQNAFGARMEPQLVGEMLKPLMSPPFFPPCQGQRRRCPSLTMSATARPRSAGTWFRPLAAHAGCLPAGQARRGERWPSRRLMTRSGDVAMRPCDLAHAQIRAVQVALPRNAPAGVPPTGLPEWAVQRQSAMLARRVLDARGSFRVLQLSYRRCGRRAMVQLTHS
jgi:hypothetical protein